MRKTLILDPASENTGADSWHISRMGSQPIVVVAVRICVRCFLTLATGA